MFIRAILTALEIGESMQKISANSYSDQINLKLDPILNFPVWSVLHCLYKNI